MSDGNWQRNLYTIWVAEFVALMGWGVIQPFLPYFIQELGVTDLAQIELYSGLAFAVHGVVMTVTAPLWGALADRFGRKLMVERAMISGAILYYLTSFVQDVPSLMLMRAVTGGLTGTVAAATTLVASGTPRVRIGYALGMLQMAVYAGTLVGPLVGGVVADAWGYRASMQVTSALWFFAALLVHLLVRESFTPSAAGVKRPGLLAGLREVMSHGGLRAIFAVRIILRLGDRTLTPVLPLFIQGLLVSGERVASVTGLVVGLSGAASAAGALLLGRISDRLGPRRVLLACTVGAAAFFAPCFVVSEVWELAALQAGASFFVGGTLTSVSTMLAALAPPGKQGAVYGVDQSASSVGNAVAPMLGAAIAMTLGLGTSFVFVALFYMVAWVAVSRLLPEPAR